MGAMKDWFVFSREAQAKSFGFSQSKKGLLWLRFHTEAEALQVRNKIGGDTWLTHLSKMKQRTIMYGPPTAEVLAARAVERDGALRDFAAGIDWPPWEVGPAQG